jgi:hypothetical protein
MWLTWTLCAQDITAISADVAQLARKAVEMSGGLPLACALLGAALARYAGDQNNIPTPTHRPTHTGAGVYICQLFLSENLCVS